MGEAEDAWERHQKWLRDTNRYAWNDPPPQPPPPPPTTHPIWAGLLTVVGIFGLVGAAVVHFDHDKYRSAVWFWLIVGGIATIVAICLWADFLADRWLTRRDERKFHSR